MIVSLYSRTNVPLAHFQAETNGNCTLFLLFKQLGFCVCILNLKKEEKSEASVVFVQQKQLVSDWGDAHALTASCVQCRGFILLPVFNIVLGQGAMVRRP